MVIQLFQSWGKPVIKSIFGNVNISEKTAIDTRSNRSTVSVIVVCHTVAGPQECLAGVLIAVNLSMKFTAAFTTVTAIHWIMPCWANGGTGLIVRREVHIGS